MTTYYKKQLDKLKYDGYAPTMKITQSGSETFFMELNNDSVLEIIRFCKDNGYLDMTKFVEELKKIC